MATTYNMFHPKTTDLTDMDVAWLTSAIAATIRNAKKGNLRNDKVRDDLFYEINPYLSDASAAFLLEIVEKLDTPTP